MKYPGYAPEVNAILDVARAADLAHEACPDISATDIIEHLTEAGSKWSWSLIEIIMDHEKRERRHAEFWSKWKRWRNRREFIKQIPRPNAVLPRERVTADRSEAAAQGAAAPVMPLLVRH